jgi:hypothetical protein
VDIYQGDKANGDAARQVAIVFPPRVSSLGGADQEVAPVRRCPRSHFDLFQTIADQIGPRLTQDEGAQSILGIIARQRHPRQPVRRASEGGKFIRRLSRIAAAAEAVVTH